MDYFTEWFEAHASRRRTIVDLLRTYHLKELGYPEDLPLLDLDAQVASAPCLALMTRIEQFMVKMREANVLFASRDRIPHARRARIWADLFKRVNKTRMAKLNEGREVVIMAGYADLLEVEEHHFLGPGWFSKIVEENAEERAARAAEERRQIVAELRADTRASDVARMVREELQRAGAGRGRAGNGGGGGNDPPDAGADEAKLLPTVGAKDGCSRAASEAMSCPVTC